MSKAHVDLETGKIHGCEKGSLKWFHEQGHIVFNSDPNKSWLLMMNSYVFDAWMLIIMSSIVIRELFPLAITLWVAYTGISLYEEWWCNKYAKIKYEEELYGNIN